GRAIPSTIVHSRSTAIDGRLSSARSRVHPVRGKGCARLESSLRQARRSDCLPAGRADTGSHMEGGRMSLPEDSRSSINLEQQRKRAKDLRRAHREGNPEAAVRIACHLPRARHQSAARVLASVFTLSEAQLVVAREAGFSSWPIMKRELEGRAAPADRGE